MGRVENTSGLGKLESMVNAKKMRQSGQQIRHSTMFMTLIIIVHLISCQNHDPINLNGHWTIIAIHGLEKEAINGGDFYTTGMRVDFESKSKKLFVKLNHYDWSTAQYEVRPDESLLVITKCDPWLIGDYYFEKESSMMSPNVIEDRLYLTEESKGKHFTLLKITNSGL